MFRPLKNFHRQLTSEMIAHVDESIVVSMRQNILKLILISFFQFRAPRFREIIKFAFCATKYINEKPEKVLTPKQYCFGNVLNVHRHQF